MKLETFNFFQKSNREGTLFSREVTLEEAQRIVTEMANETQRTCIANNFRTSISVEPESFTEFRNSINN